MKYSPIIFSLIILFIFSACNNEEKTANNIEPIKQLKTEEVAKQKSANTFNKNITSLVKRNISPSAYQNKIVTSDYNLPIEDVLVDFEKAAIKKTISSNKKQTITFPEGTKITIPANAFQLKGSGTVVNGEVEIRVKEFYKKSDFLLENLNTMSNNQLLESGGTIHIEAAYQGQECVLQNNKTIEISFPTQKKKEGMEIFYAANKGSDMNWVQGNINSKSMANVKSTPSFVQQMPIFPGGEDSMNNYLKENVRYPKFARKNNISGRAIVEFVIDRTGNISDAVVRR